MSGAADLYRTPEEQVVDSCFAPDKLFWDMAAGLSVMTSMSSTPVSAGGFDGSSNLVCAAIDVVACTEGTACSGHNFLTPRAL